MSGHLRCLSTTLDIVYLFLFFLDIILLLDLQEQIHLQIYLLLC